MTAPDLPLSNCDHEQRQHDLAQLRELESRLRFPPIFRAEPGDKPVVYGYVRSSTEWPAYRDACQDLLTWWCSEEGWHLATIFTDVGVDAQELDRPGFAALLDVLMLPESYGVVVVNPRQLSAQRNVAELLARAIRFTGAKLLLMDEQLALASPMCARTLLDGISDPTPRRWM